MKELGGRGSFPRQFLPSWKFEYFELVVMLSEFRLRPSGLRVGWMQMIPVELSGVAVTDA